LDVRFLGTAGPAGWPQPGCRCASCLRAAAGGGRSPGRVLVDGTLLVHPGSPPRPAAPGESGTAPSGGTGQGGHLVSEVPGGWEITGPDGARLLITAGPGQVPEPRSGTAPFDIVVLDLLASPAQLGGLRARGLAGPGTIAAAWCADHRIASERELARRCGYWDAVVPAEGGTLRAPVPVPNAPAADALADRRLPHRTLILGGARSGKSREAELRLAAQPEVTYVAAGPFSGEWTGADGSPDGEWAQRVAAHQARRPAWWHTVETTDLAAQLRRLSGAVLVDGIGTWLAAMLDAEGAWREPPGDAGSAARIEARVDDLVAAWRAAGGRIVAVSDQVGSGVVPAFAAGRLFRDQLGWLNQRLAAESEETVLVVAGLPVALQT
jgi:adenosylcobinamide kinase/adenosylcobinamide-phosphate guanylyltransferase